MYLHLLEKELRLKTTEFLFDGSYLGSNSKKDENNDRDHEENVDLEGDEEEIERR